MELEQNSKTPLTSTSPSIDYMSRNEYALLGGAAFVILALVVVETYLWSGFYISLIKDTDMGAYLKNARDVWEGTWPGDKPYYRAPLYSYALALIYLVGQGNLLAMAALQGLLMWGAVMLTAASGDRLTGRWGGWISGLSLLLYGGAIYWAPIFHSTTVEVFLMASTLFFLVAFRNKVTQWNSIFLGLSGSLLCMIRPNFLTILPIVFAGISWEIYRLQPSVKRKICILLLTLSFFGPIGLLSLRNTMILGRISSFSNNAGKTFKIANSYDSRVYNHGIISKEQMPVMSLDLWKHMARKAMAYWRSWEYPQNTNFDMHREQSWGIYLAFLNHGILGALVILATLILAPQWRIWWPYLFIFWSFYLTIVAFFIIGRFRIPMVPIMGVLIAGLFHQGQEWWEKQEWRKLGAVAVGVLVLFLASLPWEKCVRTVDRKNYLTIALAQKDFPSALNQVYLWRYYTPQLTINQNLYPKTIFLQLLETAIWAVKGHEKQIYPRVMKLLEENPDLPSVWLTAIDIARSGGNMREVQRLTQSYNQRFPEKGGISLMRFVKAYTFTSEAFDWWDPNLKWKGTSP